VPFEGRNAPLVGARAPLGGSAPKCAASVTLFHRRRANRAGMMRRTVDDAAATSALKRACRATDTARRRSLPRS